jgi:hypothetical protein
MSGIGGLGANRPVLGTRTDVAAPQAAKEPVASDFATLARAAIEVGRSTRKSGGPEGTETILGAEQARRAEKLVATAPPELRAALAADLARIEGPGADVGRALYLKAATARTGPLAEARAPKALREAALATLAAFAGRVSNRDGADLLARASVIDLDSRASTSGFDPTAWSERRGVIHARGQGDTRTDNDGLLQRFTGSCGPTSLQIALAEEDPVVAFTFHDVGLQSMDAKDLAGRFQAEVLAEHRSDAFSRRVQYNLARIANGLGRLEGAGAIEKAEKKALLDHVNGKGPLDKNAERALRALRALARGFPTDAEIAEIRATDVREDQGLDAKEMERALDKYLAPATGTRYRTVGGEDGLGPGAVARHVDAIARALERGVDVPLSLKEPGHFCILTAVSAEAGAGARRFLVSDPWTGRTLWTKEADFISGQFIRAIFEIDEASKDHHVDYVFLPEAS